MIDESLVCERATNEDRRPRRRIVDARRRSSGYNQRDWLSGGKRAM